MEESEEFILETAMAMSDDPLAVYRVVDLAIEKQLRDAGSNRHQSNKEAKSVKKHATKEKVPSVQSRSSEQMAIYLSKRVAPLLAQLVKE